MSGHTEYHPLTSPPSRNGILPLFPRWTNNPKELSRATAIKVNKIAILTRSFLGEVGLFALPILASEFGLVLLPQPPSDLVLLTVGSPKAIGSADNDVPVDPANRSLSEFVMVSVTASWGPPPVSSSAPWSSPLSSVLCPSSFSSSSSCWKRASWFRACPTLL